MKMTLRNNVKGAKEIIAAWKTIDETNGYTKHNGYWIVLYDDEYKKIVDLSDDLFKRGIISRKSLLNYQYCESNWIMSDSECKRRIAEQQQREEEYRRKELERQKRQAKKANLDRGVYGIVKDGKLIYIGKTEREFKVRWKEHQDIIEGRAPKPAGMILYNLLDSMDGVQFVELINLKNIKTDIKINSRDLQMMELGLISAYQPIGNWQGVKGKYELEK